jgi:hypothetical protein
LRHGKPEQACHYDGTGHALRALHGHSPNQLKNRANQPGLL